MGAGVKHHELEFIREAASFLETPPSYLHMADAMGRPADRLQHCMPRATQKLIKEAVQLSLKTALRVAVGSLPHQQGGPNSWQVIRDEVKRSRWRHTAGVAAAGAIGGSIGSAGILLELPLTTSVILRSIASTAQKWGHDLQDPNVRLQCLSVFTSGTGTEKSDVGLSSAYLDKRLAWNGLILDMAGIIGSHSFKEIFLAMERGTLPVLAKFVSLLIPALERALLKNMLSRAIPILGALSAAALNAAYCQYYSQAAHYHFGLLHLEGKHSPEIVQHQYAGVNLAQSA